LAGFRTAGLEVLSVLRAGMVVSCNPRTFSPCSLCDSTKGLRRNNVYNFFFLSRGEIV